jgi:hypothetical protein
MATLGIVAVLVGSLMGVLTLELKTGRLSRGKISLAAFVKEYGEPYSELLGIDLAGGRSKEVVKWFLAAILYSKPIRESSATKTYRCFEEKGIVSAEAIVKAGWDGLVSILDAGGYTRYDFSTADKLLEVFGNLETMYGGDLNRLHKEAKGPEDLGLRLKALGKGIGDTTVSIFLRDMRPIWDKADPKPTPLVQMAMKKLKLKDLEALARSSGLDPVRLDTALLRLAKAFLKKNRRIRIAV